VIQRAVDAVENVRQVTRDVTAAGELPVFLAALEQVRVEAVLSARLPIEPPRPAAQKPDRLLRVEETAATLGRSVWWVYRHKAVLPIVRFPNGRYGFSERKLDAWIRGRTGDGFSA
jgi:predicted DNA-binding transcriptional regulator AlpA